MKTFEKTKVRVWSHLQLGHLEKQIHRKTITEECCMRNPYFFYKLMQQNKLTLKATLQVQTNCESAKCKGASNKRSLCRQWVYTCKLCYTTLRCRILVQFFLWWKQFHQKTIMKESFMLHQHFFHKLTQQNQLTLKATYYKFKQTARDQSAKEPWIRDHSVDSGSTLAKLC